MTVTLAAITIADREPFLKIAEEHFRRLNPAFSPQADWKKYYFEGIVSNPNLFLRWIMRESRRTGFILYGIEKHRFLPRLTGMIYELFVLPEFRRSGVARGSAILAIRELEAHSPSKIQLEVMEGNEGARALWRSLDFEKVSERLVLKKKTG